MKRIWILITALAITGFVVSCTELEPTPEFRKSNADFSATASTTEIGVTAADSLSEVISIAWTDPNYAIGLSRSKFTVMIGAEGQDFVSFSSKEFKGVLSGSLLAKEINATALKL